MCTVRDHVLLNGGCKGMQKERHRCHYDMPCRRGDCARELASYPGQGRVRKGRAQRRGGRACHEIFMRLSMVESAHEDNQPKRKWGGVAHIHTTSTHIHMHIQPPCIHMHTCAYWREGERDSLRKGAKMGRAAEFGSSCSCDRNARNGDALMLITCLAGFYNYLPSDVIHTRYGRTIGGQGQEESNKRRYPDQDDAFIGSGNGGVEALAGH